MPPTVSTVSSNHTTGCRDAAAGPAPPRAAEGRILARPLPQLLNGRQVATKLGLYFGVLIAILLGIGYLALDHVGRANTRLERVLDNSLAELQLAEEGMRYSNDNSRIVLQFFLVRDNGVIEQMLARRAENSMRVSAILSELATRANSPKEEQLLRAVQETRSAYIDSYQRVLRLLLKENQPDTARTLMVQQTTPALSRYHAAWEEYWRYQVEQVKGANEQNRQQYDATRRLTVIFILIGGGLSTLIAMIATRAVVHVVNSRIRMQEEVHTLNAELEERVARRTGELTRTENQLRSSLLELRDYTSHVEAVNEFVELLQSCLTLEEAYQQSARVLSHFYPSGALLMLNASRNLLDVAATWGTSSTRKGPFAPESCWGLRKGRIHLAQPGSFGLLCDHLEATPSAAHLCVPMIAQGESLGVMSVEDPSPADPSTDPLLLERKQELTTSLAEQISLAFANLQLRETLKYQSVRDPLTGLFNRRHMEEVLQRELLRAARSRTSVAVLMADIDHFKRFNDAFGHEAGDVLLRELGALFRAEVRGGDIACRYGGEEFLIILVDAEAPAAVQRAEKLNEQVRSLHVQHRGETLRRISLSIGVAVFPHSGATASELITAADGALYKAKSGGRDRVAVAGGS